MCKESKGEAKATFDSEKNAQFALKQMDTCTQKVRFLWPKIDGNGIEFGFEASTDCGNASKLMEDTINSWFKKNQMDSDSNGSPCQGVEVEACSLMKSDDLSDQRLDAQADLFEIYIVNKSTTKETFWLFLDKPEQLEVGEEVFANSAARLTIDAGSKPVAKFGVPLQFRLGAKSINQAVGLNVKVSTSQTEDVHLTDVWESTFYTGEDHQAPDLKKIDGKARDNEIIFKDNHFNPDDAIANEWYPSQSFGLETQSGFVGMSWAARPGKKVSIAPEVKFYVSTADYKANELADYTTVSDGSAELTLNSFRGRAATVTYTASGEWKVTAGRPPKHMLSDENEVEDAIS